MYQSRNLSIYEKNQLLKYGFKEEDLLKNGELPVEYLTGLIEFCGLTIKVNQNVLIPRVESEELIDLMGNFYDSLHSDLTYLEVGTGSGAISLAFYNFLLKKKNVLEFNRFLVSDLSQDAIILAKENFQNLFGNSAMNRVEFINSNLLDNCPNDQFNLIVANLPYIPSGLIGSLDQSVKNYEPLLALDGGSTGFNLINEFLGQVINKNVLTKEGKIFLEVHETHNKNFISKNFPDIYKNFLIETFNDQFGRHRFLVLKKI